MKKHKERLTKLIEITVADVIRCDDCGASRIKHRNDWFYAWKDQKGRSFNGSGWATATVSLDCNAAKKEIGYIWVERIIE